MFTLLEIDSNPLGNLQSQAAAASSSIAETLGLAILHSATGSKVAIDVEKVIDRGMGIQKALS